MKKFFALLLAAMMVLTLSIAAAAIPADEPNEEAPAAYIWLSNSSDNAQSTALGWRIEKDELTGGDYRIFASVCFEDVVENGGSAFANIYFYDENGQLIPGEGTGWWDWAKSTDDPTPGEWRVWEQNFEAPSGWDYATVTLGFWNATGKICVGAINISSGKEMIWNRGFNGPLDLNDETMCTKVNVDLDNEGINYETVYPIEESIGTNLCLEDTTVVSLLKYGEDIGLTTDDGNSVGQYKGDLKDGVVAIPAFVPEWYGFHLNAAAVDGQIDDQIGRLGTMLVTFAEPQDFKRVRLSWYGGEGGIGLPLAVRAYYSDDLENWTEFGDLLFECEYGEVNSGWADTEEKDPVTAKYVKVEYLYESSAWGMVSELEVIAAGDDLIIDDPTTSDDPATSEDPSSETPSTSTPSTSEQPSTPTSDNGIVALAVIAAIAAAGAVVVKKTR